MGSSAPGRQEKLSERLGWRQSKVQYNSLGRHAASIGRYPANRFLASPIQSNPAGFQLASRLQAKPLYHDFFIYLLNFYFSFNQSSLFAHTPSPSPFYLFLSGVSLHGVAPKVGKGSSPSSTAPNGTLAIPTFLLSYPFLLRKRRPQIERPSVMQDQSISTPRIGP